MNKLSLLFLILLLINNCSINKKQGFWNKDQSNIDEKVNVKRILTKQVSEERELNPELEKAGRLADFLELGELMARDALNREESCGGHFREEFQTEENEAKRNDKDFTFAAAWEYKGKNQTPELHKEDLNFKHVKLTTRSYK